MFILELSDSSLESDIPILETHSRVLRSNKKVFKSNKKVFKSQKVLRSDIPHSRVLRSHSIVLESIVKVLGLEYTYYANIKQGSTQYTAERVGIIYKKNIHIQFNEIDYYNIKNFTGFARNPFIVPIKIYNNDYIFIINHITPDNVNNELNLLNDVFNNLYDDHNNKKFILMGDYNADGSYLTNKKEKTNELFTNKNLLCLTNNEKTNISKNKCYDRIFCSTNCLKYLNIVDSDINMKKIKNGYCDVDYLEYLNLSLENIKKISDHYPIFIEIKE
jgi:hypothetical protein